LIKVVAAVVEPGDKFPDGYVITSVSYELDAVRVAITKVWTHEQLKRPRCTIERHRQWGPLDVITVSRNSADMAGGRDNAVD
jgi:hypothetical protein